MANDPACRLIALDIDGTLLDDDKNIPEENIRALKSAVELGVTIILSSGRMTDSIAPWSRLIGIDHPIIAYNGARVVGSEEDGRPEIFHRPLQAEYADQMIEFHEENGVQLNYYLDDILYAKDDDSMRPWAELYAERTKSEVHYVDTLKDFIGNDPTKLILVSEPERRNELHKVFSKRFGASVNLTKTDPEYLEFLETTTNKGTALEALCRALDIGLDETMALGDGDNDAAMISIAGRGIAMKNASDAAMDAADHVTERSNSDGGVAEAIDRFVLAGNP